MIIERSLDELQTSISKIQIAFEDEMPNLPDELDVVSKVKSGRVYTLIIRGNCEEIKMKLESLNPLLIDVLPLSLEEIFIYELGGEDYEVKEVML